MRIEKETVLRYDYFNPMIINLNEERCFYYESHNYLDKYRLLNLETERVVVCAESKDELINYLIKCDAFIEVE